MVTFHLVDDVWIVTSVVVICPAFSQFGPALNEGVLISCYGTNTRY